MGDQADIDQRTKEIMEHPSYELAYLDNEFMQGEDLRPLRLELELLKPEMFLDKLGIKSSVCLLYTSPSPRDS